MVPQSRLFILLFANVHQDVPVRRSEFLRYSSPYMGSFQDPLSRLDTVELAKSLLPLFPYLRLRLLFFSPECVSPCFWQEDGSAWEGLLLIGISYGRVPKVFFVGFLRSSIRVPILVGYEDDFLGFFFPYRV